MRLRIYPRLPLSSALAFFLFCLPHLIFAKDYEMPGPRTVEEALRPELRGGPHERIEEPVQHDGYMHTYMVDTEYGVFMAQGDAMLRRLQRELLAIADMRERYVVGVAAESAVKVLIEPIHAVGRLVRKPGAALLGVPKGVYRLFESAVVGTTRESGPYEDSGLKNMIQVAAYKRRIAAHYKVDVYSSNPILQNELDRIAWASLAGYTTTFATLLVPVPNPLPLTLVSLNTVEVLNRVLEEHGPDDLRMFNMRKLKSMGIGTELADKFLDHPEYSPRHQTIIVSCLEALAHAKRRDRFLSLALGAESEEQALFYQQSAELLRFYNEQVLEVTEIKMLGRIPLGRSKERTIFFPAPIDHAIWMEKTEALFDRLAQMLRHGRNSTRIELWVTGTVSPRVRQELLERGVVAREDMDSALQLED